MELKEYIKQVAKRVLGWFPSFEQIKFQLTLDKIIELISNKEESIKKYGQSYKQIDRVGNAIDHYNEGKSVDQSYDLLKNAVEFVLYSKVNSTSESVNVAVKECSLKNIVKEVKQEQKNIEEFFDYE